MIGNLMGSIGITLLFHAVSENLAQLLNSRLPYELLFVVVASGILWSLKNKFEKSAFRIWAVCMPLSLFLFYFQSRHPTEGPTSAVLDDIFHAVPWLLNLVPFVFRRGTKTKSEWLRDRRAPLLVVIIGIFLGFPYVINALPALWQHRYGPPLLFVAASLLTYIFSLLARDTVRRRWTGGVAILYLILAVTVALFPISRYSPAVVYVLFAEVALALLLIGRLNHGT